MCAKRFRVALSFPGEKRDFIHQVADSLAAVLGKNRVLYDDYLTAELARPNLDVHLGQLYHDHSELLVPFFCAEYERKEWCGLEWRQMRDILKREQGDRIMPFRFDDAPITGVLSIDGCIKIGVRRPQEIAELILQRLGASGDATPVDAGIKEAARVPVFYLFASPAGTSPESSTAVFYRVEGESLAKSLCGLFRKEYSDTTGRPEFHHKAATSISTEEQVLLDESLGWLEIYDDPDPGVYDSPPSKDTLLLAQYSVRATKWEELLRERIKTSDRTTTPNNINSAQKNSPRTDELPQMPPEEWRDAGLILLMLLAQTYYKMLECTISTANWFTTLDLELNQSYLWTVENITNLLKNHEHLKDFPIQFEPLFPDLYPSTIRDLDWEDMVAPDAERFLSTVQKYVHSKGTYNPEEGSQAWIFIELFRPSVNAAIERAVAYNERMRRHYQKVFGSSPPVVQGISAGGSIQAGGNIETSGGIQAGGDIKADGTVQSGDRHQKVEVSSTGHSSIAPSETLTSLVVHSANYGDSDAVVDVADFLRSEILRGCRRIRVTNRLARGKDPCEFSKKELVVEYSLAGKHRRKVVAENEVLVFD